MPTWALWDQTYILKLSVLFWGYGRDPAEEESQAKWLSCIYKPQRLPKSIFKFPPARLTASHRSLSVSVNITIGTVFFPLSRDLFSSVMLFTHKHQVCVSRCGQKTLIGFSHYCLQYLDHLDRPTCTTYLVVNKTTCIWFSHRGLQRASSRSLGRSKAPVYSRHAACDWSGQQRRIPVSIMHLHYRLCSDLIYATNDMRLRYQQVVYVNASC